MKDDTGAVVTMGGGTKVSALTAASAATGAQEIPVNDAGTTKKLTVAQINAFVDPASTASSAAQTLGTGDTYVTGSGVTLEAGRLKQTSFYRCVIDLTKTAAGTATAVVTLRMGTLGTTGDAAICTFTLPTAQTAAADNGIFVVYANMRSVGSGTSAVAEGVLEIRRTGTTAGFLSTGGLQFMAPQRVTSSGFNSTTVTRVGVSINAGASSAWTTQLVQADIKNLS